MPAALYDETMHSQSSIYKISPVFVAAKCMQCDAVLYGETVLEAEAMLTWHRCHEPERWDFLALAKMAASGFLPF